MVAVLPGEPQTSRVIVLALNSSRTSPDVPPPNEPRWTPKTPCNRYTTNPDTATTAAIVSTSQKRPRNPFFLARSGATLLPSPPAEPCFLSGSVLGSDVVVGASSPSPVAVRHATALRPPF